MKPSVSVVVPVYNSQDSLPILVDRLSASLPAAFEQYELILVNDGSSDNSWQTVLGLVEKFPWVRAIDLMRNYGQHNAVLCGVRAASFDIVVTIDDDLQHPPEEIHRVVGWLDEGYDVVYGVPNEETHGFLRNMASVITKIALQSTMGAETARNVSAFRAFKTNLRDAFFDYRGPFASVDVLLTWGTRRFGAIRVRHDPRTVGRSNYTVGKLIRHAFNMMTGFSVLPLQLASIAGFTCTLFGIGILAYVLLRYFIHGSTVAGFPFLASIIAIFSGAQLFALGIIGEYLARMHFRIMDRPTYAVRERRPREVMKS